MPIIPEKRQLEDHVQGALSAQFWSQGIESARSLTGYSCTAPGEPQPLSLNAPSGLSRTQFLVAAHAVRVPVFPSYCEQHGGTVADRVLLQSGGQKWWAALTGRVKVQRAVQQRSSTTLLDRLVVGGAKKLSSNVLQDTVLRVFASGGASLQLGEMRGNFLDYTRIEAMLDLGLNAPETQPLRPAAPVKQSKHPAFALEDSGVWHSLTLSASQQLLGPVRLRGDWRLALDSGVPCPRGLGGVLTPKAPLQLLQHIAGVRPVVVDSSYGVDVVVPGAGGLVRLVGWYSPGRGEGRLELRLM
eukprot:gene6226-6463_t